MKNFKIGFPVRFKKSRFPLKKRLNGKYCYLEPVNVKKHSKDLFDNFLVEFPGSILKEDALFFKFDSAYKLAINSVAWKESERIEKALNYYNSLLFVFPETKYSDQLTEMYQNLQLIKNKTTTTKS